MSTPAVEALHDTLEPRVLALLQRLRGAAMACGWRVNQPYDLSCDEYRWMFTAELPGREAVDFHVSIAEAIAYGDGRDDEDDGVNFEVSAVTYGGRELCRVAPYNYTSACWISAADAGEVEARWALVDEGADDMCIVMPAILADAKPVDTPAVLV